MHLIDLTKPPLSAEQRLVLAEIAIDKMKETLERLGAIIEEVSRKLNTEESA